MTTDETSTITTEARGHVLLIGLHRPAKLNAFTTAMLAALGDAYTRYEDDPALRCAVVFAHGKDFTAGLDLADVAPRVAAGEALWPATGVDPWGLEGRARTKPVVVAMQGRVYTLGIELALASDVRLCSDDATFAQLEIARGIFPFGGATLRAPAQLGWGNAMRFLLTAEPFGAAEALRIGLVQEALARELLLDRATAIAETIARQAPLGVRATLASARLAQREGEGAAARALRGEIRRLMATDDAREGLQSFVERRVGRYTGR
ncbi:MAG TPA: crotonase/enoyl-CoA hydratase family protein [Polyangiaceae bacterium]|jgi:enoyl-CoA hydratase/carnithine racemase|nr:crotonase/enoyl-CoA hydratase family protein [Polyangiaceae bacterium]